MDDDQQSTELAGRLSAQLTKWRQVCAADAERYGKLAEDVCMLCEAEGPDKRNLLVRCFYQIKEVAPQFLTLKDVYPKDDPRGEFYYLQICKTCRGEFLTMLGEWAKAMTRKRGAAMNEDGRLVRSNDRANIPIRVNGAIKMVTREEFDDLQTERGY